MWTGGQIKVVWLMDSKERRKYETGEIYLDMQERKTETVVERKMKYLLQVFACIPHEI